MNIAEWWNMFNLYIFMLILNLYYNCIRSVYQYNVRPMLRAATEKVCNSWNYDHKRIRLQTTQLQTGKASQQVNN